MTALCLYPRRRNCIAVGDNKGTVRVFQIQQETATHIGTYQVANGEQIDKIFISENEQVAVMSFQNGRISLYDVKSSFQKIGDIESNSLVAHELVQNSLVVEQRPQQKHIDEYATLHGDTCLKVYTVTAPNCIRV